MDKDKKELLGKVAALLQKEFETKKVTILVGDQLISTVSGEELISLLYTQTLKVSFGSGMTPEQSIEVLKKIGEKIT